MFKLFCAAAIVTIVMAQSAFAGDCAGAAPATSAHAAAPAKQPTAPAPATQAQRPQASRSFSYQPSTATTYRPTYRSYGLWSEPRIMGSYGRRPASDKAVGNY